ncbi:uncharacterized protein LOC134530997 isoform X2 [Bacillus rossius redtenbacheri]
MSAASADLPRDCETEEKLVEGENFIMSVLYLVPKTLCGKDDIHIPDSLMDVLLALQGFLCNPAIPDRVQCATAQLFLDLYKRRYLQPAECVNVLQYYLDCVLNEKSSVTWRTDVHKLWELRSLLTKINVRSDALRALRGLLQRCTADERFLIREDGQQFLTTLLGADDSLLQNFITLMEENMPRTNKDAAVGYGKLLVHAWGKGSVDQKQCIEDFVKKLYDEMAQLQRKGIEMCQLGNIILRIFEMFHTDDTPLPLKTSICRRCIPILFGYLKSHVNRQRCNASELFFRMYPLMMYSTRDKECSFLDKQHTLIEELLRDKCHIVRVLAIMGTCRIIAENTDSVSKPTVTRWLTIIVEELSRDSKSYLVRCYVSKGFKKLLSSRLPNTSLEGMMAKMNHLYGDVNAQVREAYSELLMKALDRAVQPRVNGRQPDPGIRWWKIVQLKELLTQIEVEDCGTRKWQASLLFHSSILKDKSGTDIVQRIITLANMNPMATNKLFIFMGKKLTFVQVIEIISAIILKINKYVDKNRNRVYKLLAAEEQKVCPSPLKRKKRKRLDKENFMDDDGSMTGEESRSEAHMSSSLDRPAVMQTLLNIASILWRTFIKAFEEHPKELHDLHKICQGYLPKWFGFFKGTVAFDCLLLLMTHLPADLVAKMSGLQMSLMSQLKQLPADVPDATARALLVPLVLWGNGRCILELIQDWFNEAFRHCNLNWTLSTLGRRRKVSVIDVVPAKPLLAVRFLSIMYQHPVCWDKLLAKCYPQLREFWSFLERVKTLIVQRLEYGQPLDNVLVSDEFIRESLRLYLKLIPFLGNADRNEQHFDTFKNYSEVIQFALENMVPRVPDTTSEAEKPERVLVVTLLNDVLDVGCHPLLLVQPPIKYLRDMHLLASKLLMTGCGSLFVVFSLHLLGNTAVHLKGQVGRLDRQLLVFLHTKCVLRLSQLVLARLPVARECDLLLCFQEREVFKTVMTNVLSISKLFVGSNSQMIMMLYLPYIEAVFKLLSQDKYNIVSASSRKPSKDLPVAVAKMVNIVVAHSEQAHIFCLTLMYCFKRPCEDCDMLLSALKLLCIMVGDGRWRTEILLQCFLAAKEAVSTGTPTLGKDFERKASKIIEEIQNQLKQPQFGTSSQLDVASSVPSPQDTQEELPLDAVTTEAQPPSKQLQTEVVEESVADSAHVMESQPPSLLLPTPPDTCLDTSLEAESQRSQSPSWSLLVSAAQSGESCLDSSFEAASHLSQAEEPVAPMLSAESLSEEGRFDVQVRPEPSFVPLEVHSRVSSKTAKARKLRSYSLPVEERVSHMLQVTSSQVAGLHLESTLPFCSRRTGSRVHCNSESHLVQSSVQLPTE